MKLVTKIIEPQNREHLERLLLKLEKDSLPIWGKMTAQQMVEHLIDQVQYTNGKKIPYCEVTEQEAYKARQINIYTDTELSRNVIFGEPLKKLLFSDLNVATNQLMSELRDFDKYFEEPGKTEIHGAFGPMTYQEWLIWHSKHFYHHLKQFGLIEGSY
ncbi:DUF1569 domain-containing protein [Sphingobacterium kitahiroshimense]|uniref:DUF1569 domain-containing protein n=1 Tax=Sphingobacterium kitahiroshimense TaxID=470446 RepID=UPI003207EC5C